MKPLDEEGRRLIAEVTAADRPAAGADAQIWESLASRLDAPLSPTAAAASRALESQVAGSVAASTSLGTKLLLSIVAPSVFVAGGTVWYTTRATPVEEARPQREVPAAVQSEEETASSPGAELAQPSVTAPPVASDARVEAAASRPSRASTARSGSNLSAETELLAAAQRALSGGSPSRALDLLERHRDQFQRGALAQERDAARVLALCALGRDAQAERERQRFIRLWPTSPLRERIHAGCK